MSEKFKLAVFIGRFQPFHKAHAQVVRDALKHADQVLIIMGSHAQARTIKNPFTSAERKAMVQAALTESEYNQVAVVPIRDYHYSDTAWVSNIQSIVLSLVDAMDIDDSEVTLIANYKDSSSYYLELFPQWHKTVVWGEKLNATDVRTTMFNENCGSEDWKHYLPDGVFAYLQANFIGTEAHASLIKEQKYIEEYKRKWAASPYPVTHVTTDSVVVKSGHVLLVNRKSEPGKGLLALPGGFIKQDERLIDGAMRELKEETRIAVQKTELKEKVKECHVFDYPGRSLRGRTITHAYFVDLGKGDLPKVKGSDDAEHAIWVPIADLVDLESSIFEDHLNIINYFLSRAN